MLKRRSIISRAPWQRPDAWGPVRTDRRGQWLLGLVISWIRGDTTGRRIRGCAMTLHRLDGAPPFADRVGKCIYRGQSGCDQASSWCRSHRSWLAVDAASVVYVDHQYQQLAVSYCVDHSVVAYADSEGSWGSGECGYALWARAVGQVVDSVLHSAADGFVEVEQGLSGARLYLDVVRAHR